MGEHVVIDIPMDSVNSITSEEGLYNRDQIGMQFSQPDSTSIYNWNSNNIVVCNNNNINHTNTNCKSPFYDWYFPNSTDTNNINNETTTTTEDKNNKENKDNTNTHAYNNNWPTSPSSSPIIQHKIEIMRMRSHFAKRRETKLQHGGILILLLITASQFIRETTSS